MRELLRHAMLLKRAGWLPKSKRQIKSAVAKTEASSQQIPNPTAYGNPAVSSPRPRLTRPRSCPRSLCECVRPRVTDRAQRFFSPRSLPQQASCGPGARRLLSVIWIPGYHGPPATGPGRQVKASRPREASFKDLARTPSRGPPREAVNTWLFSSLKRRPREGATQGVAKVAPRRWSPTLSFFSLNGEFSFSHGQGVAGNL